MMKMVATDNNVNSRMHFDAADLRTGQILLIVDMMYMVIFYNGEHTT